jgi:hypothetical protein
MDKSSFLYKALPHIIAIVIFLAISIFMYRPIIFEGKVMDQNDINQGKGANQEIIEFREATGEEALWTNSMFGGMPAYLINLKWSGASILWNIQRTITLYLPQPVGENFLAFLSFYILCLVFGIRPYLAIGGAIAFGLSTFYVISIQAGHIWKIRAIAYMPAVLAGVKLVFDRKYVRGFLLTSFSAGFLINTNHLQITYYLFILLFAYGISELVYALKSKELPDLAKKVGILSLGATLAIGTTFGKIWTTYEYGEFSIRGKSELSTTPQASKEGLDRDYAFRWSNGIWETMMLYIPHIYGGASGVYDGKDSEVGKLLSRNNVSRNEINQIERAYLGYWGNLPGTAGPAYAGAAICFLFVLSLFFLDKRIKYWMVAIIVFSILLSWGKNFPSFNNLMFDVFPGYNKFRAVTMIIILPLMLMPLMGFLGIETIISNTWNKEQQKKILIALGITTGLALIAWFFTNPPAVEGVQKAISDAIQKDRKSIIQKDVFRSILYVLLTFGVLYFYLQKKISVSALTVILIAIVILDLGLVDSRYLNDSVYKRPEDKSFLSETPADAEILKDTEQGYRVLNLQDPFNEARTSYFHHSIGGYHGAKMRRYQDLISNQLVPEMQEIINDQGLSKDNSEVLSMLNTKYLLAGYQANAVIPNPYANGNAWIVDKIESVNSPDEEINMLDQVDLDHVAVIDVSKFNIENVASDTTATIRLLNYQPNKLQYKSNSQKEVLAVFSEIYYPKGWKAFIDDKEVEIIRANYILRALKIPAGNHNIEFRFEPKAYSIGNTVMWISSLLLLALVIVLPGKKLIFDRNN